MPEVSNPHSDPLFLSPDACQLLGHHGTFQVRGEGLTVRPCGFKLQNYGRSAVGAWEGADLWTGLAPLIAHGVGITAQCL